MEGSMGRWGRLAALVVALEIYAGIAHAQDGGSGPRAAELLCQVSETVLFTCLIDRKIVSICGRGQGQPVYRFGRLGRLEIEISDLHYASTGFSGGGESQVQADTPTHRYVVYAETHRTAFGADGRHDPQSSTGLFVQSGGRTVSSRRCATDPGLDGKIEALLPAGEYVSH